MKIKFIGAIIILAVILGACASDPMVKWGQTQQMYNVTIAEVIRLREPCVTSVKWPDGGPNHILCFIDDETMVVISEVRDNLRELLDRARAAAEVGNDLRADDFLLQAELVLEDLLFYQLRAIASEN